MKRLVESYLVIKVGDMFVEKIQTHEIKVDDYMRKIVVTGISFVYVDSLNIRKYRLPLPNESDFAIRSKTAKREVLKLVLALQEKGFDAEVIREDIYEEIEERKLEIKAIGTDLELR